MPEWQGWLSFAFLGLMLVVPPWLCWRITFGKPEPRPRRRRRPF